MLLPWIVCYGIVRDLDVTQFEHACGLYPPRIYMLEDYFSSLSLGIGT